MVRLWPHLAKQNSVVKLCLFLGEQDIYEDILQEDFVDSYNNLTLKSILTLKYYANLKKDKLLLLKTDDDSYVHVGELIFVGQQ